MKKQTYLKLRGLLAENDMTIAELADLSEEKETSPASVKKV